MDSNVSEPSDDEVQAAFEVLRRKYRADRAARSQDDVSFYTTLSLPPDCNTREKFHARVRNIPTARKSGRTWIVPAADYLAALSRPTPPKPTPKPAPKPVDTVESWLAQKGAKLRKGAKQ